MGKVGRWVRLGESRLIRIASRASRLALAQSEEVLGKLAEAWPQHRFEIAVIDTRGDREIDRPLPQIGGKGLFTEALEHSLLSGEVDLAVHSLKDLPTELAAGLKVGAVSEREDARDAWLTGPTGPQHPRDAPPAFRVGTSSERRRAQMLDLRPEVQVESIRGNVETRLRKLEEGQYDALIMAAAGLNRLGLSDRVTSFLQAPAWLPAPGQGAIAVESRADDDAIDALLEPIEDEIARAEVDAERATLATLQGGCQVPVGALAEAQGDKLSLHALVAMPDGSRLMRAESRGPRTDPVALGQRVAEQLLAQGAAEILESVRQAQGGP